MVLLFSCGCETEASGLAGPRFFTLTWDTPSTGGTKNWGTLTETLPWATLSFTRSPWRRSLKQWERKINKRCFSWIMLLTCDGSSNMQSSLSTWSFFFTNINRALGGILCAPGLCFYQFWEPSQGVLCRQGAEWWHGGAGYLLYGPAPSEW